MPDIDVQVSCGRSCSGPVGNLGNSTTLVVQLRSKVYLLREGVAGADVSRYSVVRVCSATQLSFMFLFGHEDSLNGHIACRHYDGGVGNHIHHISRVAPPIGIPCQEDATIVRCSGQGHMVARLQICCHIGTDGTVGGLVQGNIVACCKGCRNVYIAVRHSELTALSAYCHCNRLAIGINHNPLFEEVTRLNGVSHCYHIARICRCEVCNDGSACRLSQSDCVLRHLGKDCSICSIASHFNLITWFCRDLCTVELPFCECVVCSRSCRNCAMAAFIVCAAACYCTACCRTCIDSDSVLLATVRINFTAQSNCLAQCARSHGHVAAVVADVEVILHTHIDCTRCDGHRKVRIICRICVELEVVDQNHELVGAVEVTHCNISILTLISMEVNAILFPVIWAQCPFAQQCECIGI